MDYVIDWLNENENRAYPLLEGASNTTYNLLGTSWRLPDNLILDLQLIATSFGLYENEQYNPIYLKNLVYNPVEGVTFKFGGALINQQVTEFKISEFEVNYPIYVRNPDGCLLVVGEGLQNFVNLCAGNSIDLNLLLPVESSVCVEYRKAWLGVNSLNVSPEKKSSLTDKHTPLLPLENKSPLSSLTGDILFLEGYNFNVSINNGAIDLIVGPGYGLSADCTTHFISSEFLDCGSVVSYINGIPPDENGNFRLIQGKNIVISSGDTMNTFSDNFTEIANAHTLFVSLSFQKTDLCSPVTPSIL